MMRWVYGCEFDTVALSSSRIHVDSGWLQMMSPAHDGSAHIADMLHSFLYKDRKW